MNLHAYLEELSTTIDPEVFEQGQICDMIPSLLNSVDYIIPVLDFFAFSLASFTLAASLCKCYD